jgi:hypothetical protein
MDLQDFANPIIRLELLLGQTFKAPTSRVSKNQQDIDADMQAQP